MEKKSRHVSLTLTANQILDLAKRLMRAIDTLDLDTIDGEFYWRCCRPDFASAVSWAREKFPKTLSRTTEILVGRVIVEVLLHYLHVTFNIPQPFVLAHLVRDAPIPMKGYSVTRQEGFDPDVREPYDNLLIKITSANMTGTDVERVVRAWYQLPDRQFVGNHFDSLSPFEVNAERATAIWEFLDYEHHRFKPPRISIHVSLDLVVTDSPRANPGPVGFDDLTGEFVVAFGDVPPPYVEIVVGLPLPPPQCIANLYDELVRAKYKWHHQLAGIVTRQYPESAIRTWTVGLLISQHANDERMSFDEAMTAFEDATGYRSVSQKEFTDDRTALIKRTPEAEEYVYARRRRGR